MNRNLWLVLSVTALSLGLVLLYFALAPANPLSEPPTPSNCKELKRGEMMVKIPTNYIGTYKGDIIIQIWGLATINNRLEPMTPKGLANSVADDVYPLRGVNMYAAVLFKGGKVYLVGDSNDFYAIPIENLFLGTNESHRSDDLEFADNQGVWYWKVCAKNGQATLLPFHESRVP